MYSSWRCRNLLYTQLDPRDFQFLFWHNNHRQSSWRMACDTTYKFGKNNNKHEKLARKTLWNIWAWNHYRNSQHIPKTWHFKIRLGNSLGAICQAKQINLPPQFSPVFERPKILHEQTFTYFSNLCRDNRILDKSSLQVMNFGFRDSYDLQ